MRNLKKELFKVIYLNKRNQIIDTVDLFEGTLDSISIPEKEIRNCLPSSKDGDI